MRRRGMIFGGLLVLLGGLILACNGASTDLTYSGIVFQIGIPAGEDLLGTGLHYVRLTDKGAEVTIDGQTAVKQKGDSLDWSGNPVDGVDLSLSTRVLWHTAEMVYIGGTAKLVVHNPAPEEMEIPKDSPLKFANAPVTYSVRRSHLIPGTTVEFIRNTEDGAELGGTGEYPYYKFGDSVVWEGRLREGVYLQLNVRLGVINDEAITVSGTATVWIEP